MKKRIKSILLGISDAIFPNFKNSISKKENGINEVNKARLTSAFLSWLLLIAVLRGWIELDKALEFIKLLFTA